MALISELCPWPFAQSELTCYGFTKHSHSTELTEDEIASAFIKVYDFPQAIRDKCYSSLNGQIMAVACDFFVCFRWRLAYYWSLTIAYKYVSAIRWE